ncbi:MAG: DUF2867 domain-containing protein [Ardenticatenaceae bacterium]
MKSQSFIQQVPEIASLMEGADHMDIKTVQGELGMREFIAGLLSYQPAWMTFLYHVRGWFVRLLGMRQHGVPQAPHMRPEDVPMKVGQPALFFTVVLAEEERYWFSEISESHLTAHLGVVVEPLTDGRKHFHVVTLVHYNSWAGPIYFNVIRPFHHIVVYSMAKGALRPRIVPNES